MKRALKVALWVAVLLLALYALRVPIDRAFLAVRLWREELQPPLTVPVKGVRRSVLTDSWGAPRSGGRRHEGIDIFAPCGRPVVSATEGIVASVGHNALGGQVVFVFGPGGSWHYYAHLSGFADIARGEHVFSGDVLGYVGNTGDAAGGPCHLHYGIYRNGRAHDPYPFLAARRKGAPSLPSTD